MAGPRDSLPDALRRVITNGSGIASEAPRDIAGQWQGKLSVGPITLRIVVQIVNSNATGWTATLFSIDQSPSPMPIDSVTLAGDTLSLAISAVQGTYEGEVNLAGNSISGTWRQRESFPLTLARATPDTAWPLDKSPHSVKSIRVDGDVSLEVLDWGGSRRPLVLLAGLGDTAHTYDKFAPKLSSKYHVYGVTRRGFGRSSAPPPEQSDYTADRLGDDVLAIIDALRLDRPVLVGHSIAGQELSSIGTRYPERVAGLIYLDAAYPYAFYDETIGDLVLDALELKDKLENLVSPVGQSDQRHFIEDLLRRVLPRFEMLLQKRQRELDATPSALREIQKSMPLPPIARAILAGQRKHRAVRVPTLVIYASPHDLGPGFAVNAEERTAYEAYDAERIGALAGAFEQGVPSARIVRIARADHYVFKSHESEVLHEMTAFLDTLPP